MAQWYNQIFYKDGEQPKPDAPVYTTLPIVDETSDIPDEEGVAEKSKLEFAFRDNFYFKGLPSDAAGQQIFFNNNTDRQSDPANLREIDKTLSVNLASSALNAVLVTPISYVANKVWGVIKLPYTIFKGTNPYKSKGGSRRNTKKYSRQNQRQIKKTQRKLLTVDDR